MPGAGGRTRGTAARRHPTFLLRRGPAAEPRSRRPDRANLRPRRRPPEWMRRLRPDPVPDDHVQRLIEAAARGARRAATRSGRGGSSCATRSHRQRIADETPAPAKNMPGAAARSASPGPRRRMVDAVRGRPSRPPELRAHRAGVLRDGDAPDQDPARFASSIWPGPPNPPGRPAQVRSGWVPRRPRTRAPSVAKSRR